MELGRLELALLVIGLVDRDDHWRRRSPKQLGSFEVGRGHADCRIDDEDDHIGFRDRQAGLLLHAQLDGIVRIDLEPAGIDQDEPAAVPLPVAVQAVTCRTRTVFDDGRA